MQIRRFWALAVFQLAAAILLIRLLFAWSTPWNAQRYLGSALVIVGILFIVIARFQLGKSFSVKAEARELVTTGLYSKIRNPIYVFGGIMIAGALLIVQKPALWILFAVAIVAQAFRAHREAEVLEATFGDAYREYRKRTWF